MQRLNVLLVAYHTPGVRRPPDVKLIETQYRRIRAMVGPSATIRITAPADLQPPALKKLLVPLEQGFGDGFAVAKSLEASPSNSTTVIIPLDLRISAALVNWATAATVTTLWSCSGGNRLRLLTSEEPVSGGSSRVLRVGYGLPQSWCGVATISRELAEDYLRHAPGKELWSFSERLDHLLELGHEIRAEMICDGNAERITRWGGVDRVNTREKQERVLA